MLMDFNNNFKCHMGRDDLSHVQFNRKLWNLRPVVKDSGVAMRVPLLPEAYAHVKENQQAWLSGSRPLPDQCPRYPPIRRMLLGVTSPAIAPRIGAARDAERRMLKWSEGMEPRFISWNVAAMHTYDITFPDAWSRKKIKTSPSRKQEVPHGEESVDFLVNDELFYHAGNLTVPARPDSGMGMRQGPSGLEPKPNTKDDERMDQDDDHMEGKGEKSSEMDLGALERDLLEYQFSEGNDGEVNGNLLLMTPSSFMSPTKEAPVSLSPVEPISLAMDYRRRDLQKLLHESPRRRKIEENMRVSFLSTLPEEEWERYQSELERETGVTWNRVTFVERSWDVIRRYGRSR